MKTRESVLWPLILVATGTNHAAQTKDTVVDLILLPEQGTATVLGVMNFLHCPLH